LAHRAASGILKVRQPVAVTREEIALPAELYQIIVNAHDPSALARFWAAVLEYQILLEEPDEVVIGRDENTYPGLVFVPVTDVKAGPNRLHIDLAPGDLDAEVRRILALGARRADVGQPADVTWEVLADPEGNEFCVLRPKTSLLH
jgi:predicted enzyme related to lactoylglutathione lyase